MWLVRVIVRLVLAGLLMAALGAALIYGSWKLLHPFLLQRQQSKEIAQLETRVEQLKREHGELKRTVRRLSTPQGRAEELRRLGYVRPKERIIRFLRGHTPLHPPAEDEPPAAPVGVKDRIKRWLQPRLAPADAPQDTVP
jgi:cell division protein FtsB